MHTAVRRTSWHNPINRRAAPLRRQTGYRPQSPATHISQRGGAPSNTPPGLPHHAAGRDATPKPPRWRTSIAAVRNAGPDGTARAAGGAPIPIDRRSTADTAGRVPRPTARDGHALTGLCTGNSARGRLDGPAPAADAAAISIDRSSATADGSLGATTRRRGRAVQSQPSRRWTSGAAARRVRPDSPAPATRRATTTTINTRSAQPTDLSWVSRRSAPADHAGRSCHRHHCATAAAAITPQTQRLHHGAGTVVHPSATAIAATHQVGAYIPITRTHSRQGQPAPAPPERRAQPQHRPAAIDRST